MPKYLSLQILRAFAVWLVVGNHYMQMYFNYQAENIVSKFFVMRGGFGVDLFFVLSGALDARMRNPGGSRWPLLFVCIVVPGRPELRITGSKAESVIRVLVAAL